MPVHNVATSTADASRPQGYEKKAAARRVKMRARRSRLRCEHGRGHRTRTVFATKGSNKRRSRAAAFFKGRRFQQLQTSNNFFTE